MENAVLAQRITTLSAQTTMTILFNLILIIHFSCYWRMPVISISANSCIDAIRLSLLFGMIDALRPLRHPLESQPYLKEMFVLGENAGHSKLLHQGHRGEVGKRNTGFILEVLSEAP